MRDRCIPCKHYNAEHMCNLGKDCTFWDKCQTCKNYTPAKGRRPCRIDRRGELLEKARKKDERYDRDR